MRTLVTAVLAAAIGLMVLAGSGVTQAQTQTQTQAQTRTRTAYALGPGDVVRITVYGEPDLSGSFTVGTDGRVAVPLVGPAVLAGMTPMAAAEHLEHALRTGGVLQAPAVAVDVVTYRPFFIIGEVNRQGPHPYLPGLTVHKAAAVAGGFTRRADRDDVRIKRGGQGEPVPVDLDAPVWPGDIVIVEERWF